MSAADEMEFGKYEALVAELRAAVPVAPERLRQRVLEGAPAPRSPMSRRRKLVFVVVPVAAALAVGAALIHGFVSSGSRSSAHPVVFGTVVHGAVARTSQQRESAQKQTPSSWNSVQAAPAYKAATPLKLTGAGQLDTVNIPRNRLVHAVASLQVQVKNRSELSKATNKATQIVGSLGGYAQSVHYQAEHHGSGSAVLALRVPVQRAEVAIAKLANLGTLLSQQVSTQDLQSKLTHETSRIGSLKRAIAIYEQALQSGTLSPTQRVEIQIKLQNAEHALRLQRKARQGTLASGATADISLLLTTPNHAVVVTPHKSGRLGRLLRGAAGFLALEGIIVLYALVVLSPLLVLGGLAWVFLRERRRRDERRLLTAS
jgi:uncharacterized protein DUF4349